MSIAAVAGGISQLCTLQNQYQRVHKQFKQLGPDLQAGALTKAPTDFVTLSQSAASQLSGDSPLTQALNNVGAALQSGDLSAAQGAFALLRKVGACAVPHGPHVPPMGGLSQGLESDEICREMEAAGYLPGRCRRRLSRTGRGRARTG